MATRHPSLKAHVAPLGGSPPWFSIALERARGFHGELAWAVREELDVLGRVLTERKVNFNVHPRAGVLFVGAERAEIDGLLQQRGLV